MSWINGVTDLILFKGLNGNQEQPYYLGPIMC